MRIIVVGCGRIGSGLALTLCRSGHAITVIDSDGAAFERLGPAFKGEKLEGVGFDKDVLTRAGIERADALAAFTASDEANAVIARMARQVFRVPSVVARLYDPGKAEIYHRLGIQTISAVNLGIRRAVEMLCYTPVNTVFTLGDGDVDIVQIEVPRLLVGRTVNDLSVLGEIHVVAILRNNKTILPTMGMAFAKDDMLYLAVAAKANGRLKRLLDLGDGKGM
jgi:trk system potassium uptake protein TrkA